MRTTSIAEKNNLDITGIQNRQRFLSAYEQELKKAPTAILVKESYSTMIKDALGSSRYMFVSINLPNAELRKATETKQNKRGGKLPKRFIPLGLEFYESLQSGTAFNIAANTLLHKFMIRLNRKVLGSRFKRFGESLKCLGFFESSNKRCSGESTNHLHVLIEVPKTNQSPEDSASRLTNVFRELFSLLVCPIRHPSNNRGVLRIIPGRMTGRNAHPKYILKQIGNWETASARLFTCGMPGISNTVI